jgi:putative transposase
MKAEELYFSTYTNLNLASSLKNDEYQEIIVDSLRFLVNSGKVSVYGFVIMPNHLRLIWKMNEGHKLNDVQRDFLKFTEQMVQFKLLRSKGSIDPKLFFSGGDANTRVWKRKGTSVSLSSYEEIVRKLSFLHKDPTDRKWNLCDSIDKYKYSSFRFYLSGDREFEFLSDIYELKCIEEENIETIMDMAS